MKFIFLPNGQTFCADDQGQQVPELQQSWIKVFFHWLDDHDVDPLEVEFTMPDGQHMRAVENSDGSLSWEPIVTK